MWLTGWVCVIKNSFVFHICTFSQSVSSDHPHKAYVNFAWDIEQTPNVALQNLLQILVPIQDGNRTNTMVFT